MAPNDAAGVFKAMLEKTMAPPLVQKKAVEALPPLPIKSESTWVGIVFHTIRTVEDMKNESPFLWIKCHERVSIRTLKHQYFRMHPLDEFSLKHLDYYPHELDQVMHLRARSPFVGSNVIVLRAIEDQYRSDADRLDRRTVNKVFECGRSTDRYKALNIHDPKIVELSDDEDDKAEDGAQTQTNTVEAARAKMSTNMRDVSDLEDEEEVEKAEQDATMGELHHLLSKQPIEFAERVIDRLQENRSHEEQVMHFLRKRYQTCIVDSCGRRFALQPWTRFFQKQPICTKCSKILVAYRVERGLDSDVLSELEEQIQARFRIKSERHFQGNRQNMDDDAPLDHPKALPPDGSDSQSPGTAPMTDLGFDLSRIGATPEKLRSALNLPPITSAKSNVDAEKPGPQPTQQQTPQGLCREATTAPPHPPQTQAPAKEMHPQKSSEEATTTPPHPPQTQAPAKEMHPQKSSEEATTTPAHPPQTQAPAKEMHPQKSSEQAIIVSPSLFQPQKPIVHGLYPQKSYEQATYEVEQFLKSGKRFDEYVIPEYIPPHLRSSDQAHVETPQPQQTQPSRQPPPKVKFPTQAAPKKRARGKAQLPPDRAKNRSRSVQPKQGGNTINRNGKRLQNLESLPEPKRHQSVAQSQGPHHYMGQYGVHEHSVQTQSHLSDPSQSMYQMLPQQPMAPQHHLKPMHQIPPQQQEMILEQRMIQVQQMGIQHQVISQPSMPLQPHSKAHADFAASFQTYEEYLGFRDALLARTRRSQFSGQFLGQDTVQSKDSSTNLPPLPEFGEGQPEQFFRGPQPRPQIQETEHYQTPANQQQALPVQPYMNHSGNIQQPQVHGFSQDPSAIHHPQQVDTNLGDLFDVNIQANAQGYETLYPSDAAQTTFAAQDYSDSIIFAQDLQTPQTSIQPNSIEELFASPEFVTNPAQSECEVSATEIRQPSPDLWQQTAEHNMVSLPQTQSAPAPPSQAAESRAEKKDNVLGQGYAGPNGSIGSYQIPFAPSSPALGSGSPEDEEERKARAWHPPTGGKTLPQPDPQSQAYKDLLNAENELEDGELGNGTTITANNDNTAGNGDLGLPSEGLDLPQDTFDTLFPSFEPSTSWYLENAGAGRFGDGGADPFFGMDFHLPEPDAHDFAHDTAETQTEPQIQDRSNSRASENNGLKRARDDDDDGDNINVGTTFAPDEFDDFNNLDWDWSQDIQPRESEEIKPHQSKKTKLTESEDEFVPLTDVDGEDD